MAPVEKIGYFGEPTASIDWCEHNYEISFYIAEFWNTASNLFLIVPPLMGFIKSKAQGMEMRFLICHLSVLVIGIGSLLFHMTLLFHMQLMDEIPMIYGTSVIGYSLYQIREPLGRKNWFLASLLLTYCLVFTVAYLAFKDPYIHEGMFIFLTLGLIWLGLRQYYDSDHSHRERKCTRLFQMGLVCYALGGLSWNADNHLCPRLTHLRRQVLPMWLTALSQLHAWWHFFSGIGTYFIITSFIGFRLRFLKTPFHIQWRWFGPIVQIKSSSA